MPSTRYVTGETRYMKTEFFSIYYDFRERIGRGSDILQKPGKAVGGWKTPLNTRVSENMSVAMLPAVSASGRAAMSMCAKVLAKMKNCMQKRRIRP